jgi:hypothetical protein
MSFLSLSPLSLFFFLKVVLGFELRVLHLRQIHSPFCFSYFSK